MFELIRKKIEDPVLAIRITSEITAREHLRLDQLMRTHIAAQGRIRLLLIVQHYPSLSSAEALYEDLRMVKLHSEHIDRMAVVGDKPWKGTWVGLFGLFSSLEADYFDMERIEDAWRWITAGITPPATA